MSQMCHVNHVAGIPGDMHGNFYSHGEAGRSWVTGSQVKLNGLPCCEVP